MLHKLRPYYYFMQVFSFDDFDRVIILRGSYDVILVKQDENGEQLNSEATFEVNGVTKKVVGKLS